MPSVPFELTGYSLSINFDWLRNNTDGVLGVCRILESLPFVMRTEYLPDNVLIVHTKAEMDLQAMCTEIDKLFGDNLVDEVDVEFNEEELDRHNQLTVEEVSNIVAAIRGFFDYQNEDILKHFLGWRDDGIRKFAQIDPIPLDRYTQQFRVFKRLGFYKRHEKVEDAYREYLLEHAEDNAKCMLDPEQSKRWWSFYHTLGNPSERRGLGWYYAKYISRMQLSGHL